MADALCGPSNALQSFQKHTQLDRTLQQDRLAQRQRSHETPNSQVDAEFEAFKAAGPGQAPFLGHSNPILHHAPIPPSGSLPGWASDFQMMNLNGARQSPIPAARFRHEAPLQRSSPGPWHTEFMREEKASAVPVGSQFTHSPTMNQGYNTWGPMSGFNPMQAGPFAQQPAQAMQVEQIDDAAFEAAFNNAAAMFEQPEQSAEAKGKERLDEGQETHTQADYAMQNMLLERQNRKRLEYLRQEQEASQASGKNASEETFSFDMSHAAVDAPEAFTYDAYTDSINDTELAEAEATRLNTTGANITADLREQDALLQERLAGYPLDMPALSQHIPLSQDGIEQEPRSTGSNVEADELSRTAGQLLDNLKHEQSDKFANSNFMNLMRQLRDKEVRVDGETFVEVAHALHPGGRDYPHDTNANRPVVSLTEDRYSTGDMLV